MQSNFIIMLIFIQESPLSIEDQSHFFSCRMSDSKPSAIIKGKKFTPEDLKVTSDSDGFEPYKVKSNSELQKKNQQNG